MEKKKSERLIGGRAAVVIAGIYRDLDRGERWKRLSEIEHKSATDGDASPLDRKHAQLLADCRYIIR